MKKIIAILVSLIMVAIVFVACSSVVNENEIETSTSTTVAESTILEQETDYYETQPSSTEYYVEETTVQTYYHSALEGCVIVKQDGSQHVIYKKKCEAFGTLQSGTCSVYRGSGTLNSSFMCQNCRNVQSVQLHSEMQ